MNRPCLMLTRRDRGCGRWGTKNLGGLTYCAQHYAELFEALKRAVWDAGDSPVPSDVVNIVGAAETARRKSNEDAIVERTIAEHQAEIDAFHESMQEENEAWVVAQQAKLLEKHPAGPVVYFVRNEDTGAIKIGTAVDARKRLSGLRTSSAAPLTLVATIPGDRDVERVLHNRFRAHRIRGEWFQPAEELVGYIEGVS